MVLEAGMSVLSGFWMYLKSAETQGWRRWVWLAGLMAVTTVGVFQLTERGVELVRVMPGIDIQKDIIAASPMRIVLPPSGEVPVADASVVTGAGFRLAFPG